MIKWLLRTVLLLIVYFLAGFSQQLYANAYNISAEHVQNITCQSKIKSSLFASAESTIIPAQFVSSNTTHDSNRILAIGVDNKDEKIKYLNFKKKTSSSNYFIDVYFAPLEDTPYHTDYSLPVCNYLAYYLSHSYLRFCVFRI